MRGLPGGAPSPSGAFVLVSGGFPRASCPAPSTRTPAWSAGPDEYTESRVRLHQPLSCRIGGRLGTATGGGVAREVDQDPPVPGERLDGHVLLGTMVAAADRTELDGGHTAVEEEDRVGRAVSADDARVPV